MSRATNVRYVRSLLGTVAASALVASAFVAVPAGAAPDAPIRSDQAVTPAAFPPDEFTFTEVTADGADAVGEAVSDSADAAADAA